MPRTPRLHLAAISIVVATLLTGCAVVEPAYHDDDGTPVYRERYSDPYYGSSPGYYDQRPRPRDYYYTPRNDWRDRDDRDERYRARPDHRDDRDARDRHPPKPQPPAQNQPQPRVVPKVTPHEEPPRERPPRNKSDRYNPKTGQYLPKADDMP